MRRCRDAGKLSRRTLLAGILAGGAATSFSWGPTRAGCIDASRRFRLRYLLSSCLYGDTDVRQILPEVDRVGANAIDIWPRVHGNQREQVDEMGIEAFQTLLAQHQVDLGCITQYALGPFQLARELAVAEQLGCQTIVTGARGPSGLKGQELKSAVDDFLRQLEPHLRRAERHGVTLAIENHGNSLIESVDAIRWLADRRPSPNLAIALAPYHLPQDPQLIAGVIRDLADRLRVFYAWQHGKGCMVKLPKSEELLQMPGRGSLDFAPLLAALQNIEYSGWTSIFMHPVPRGIPIHESVADVTAEINQSRSYLDSLID